MSARAYSGYVYSGNFSQFWHHDYIGCEYQ